MVKTQNTTNIILRQNYASFKWQLPIIYVRYGVDNLWNIKWWRRKGYYITLYAKDQIWPKPLKELVKTKLKWHLPVIRLNMPLFVVNAVQGSTKDNSASFVDIVRLKIRRQSSSNRHKSFWCVVVWFSKIN